MKTMLKATLAGLILLFISTPTFAQNQILQPRETTLTAIRDFNNAALEYCNTQGQSGSATDKNKIGRVPISATAASTTVTGTGAFANVAAGDILYVNVLGVTQIKVVTARASADSITIDSQFSAAAVTNLKWEYRTLVCGVADNSGAVSFDGFHSMTWQIQVDAITAASLDYQIECRLLGAASGWTIVIGPTNKTATGRFKEVINDGWHECRIGIKMNTDAGGAEQITLLVTGRR